MRNDFCGGFPVRTDNVRSVCSGIKTIFEKEEMESKERIRIYLAEHIPILGDIGLSVERLLKVKLPRQFRDKTECARLADNASDGIVYSSLLAGNYTICGEIYEIWYKNRLTSNSDFNKASYLLNAVAMVDSEYVYLETKEASWLGRMEGYLQ